MRPVGAIFFGHMGDHFGRRNVLGAIILIMGAATALIGLLPTYASVGVTAPALLILLRLIQGASAGAETAGSNSLVAEFAPHERRGFFVAFTYAFANRSEEHTSELQSLMRISYAVFCLKKKKYRN